MGIRHARLAAVGILLLAMTLLGTAQEQFDAFYNGIPPDDPFWQVVIGDPGPELLFDNAVYLRGAMAVHALRLAVGDRDFFRILHAWTTRKAGGNGTIPQFMRLAERVSGEQLDDLFQTWLFTAGRPVLEGAAAAAHAKAAPARSAAAARTQLRQAERLRR